MNLETAVAMVLYQMTNLAGATGAPNWGNRYQKKCKGALLSGSPAYSRVITNVADRIGPTNVLKISA